MIVVIGVLDADRPERPRGPGPAQAILERLVTAVETGGGSRPAASSGGLSGLSGDGMLVLAGTTSYHRLDCTISEARDEAHVIGLQDAFARQLEACRVCRPPALASAAQ